MSIRLICTRLLQACVLPAILLAGCSQQSVPNGDETPVPVSGTALLDDPGTPGVMDTPGTPEIESTPSAADTGSPITMRIWLPPQFSPDRDTPAGALLAARLDEFTLLHPGIRITVRMKGETGPGGMVSSLAATTGIVTEALPDLILMPRTEMERAAQAGLLHPFPEPLDTDWYDFGRALATFNTDIYGLPLAADALVLIYRPSMILDPPNDWTTTLNAGTPLLFAGGSVEAYFTFALYEAAGGRLVDEDDRPYIDQATLAAVLDFYAQAEDSGVLPASVAKLPSETGVFQSFQTEQTAMAVSWVSNLFLNPSEDVASTGLPTVTSVPYTLVTGWMWALSNPDPNRQLLAGELAAFLTVPEFLTAWTQAAGLLPARPTALAAWPDSQAASLASRIVLSAHPLPALQVVETTGPAFHQAVEAVLTGELSPQEAAAAAVDRVNAP